MCIKKRLSTYVSMSPDPDPNRWNTIAVHVGQHGSQIRVVVAEGVMLLRKCEVRLLWVGGRGLKD